jgi:AraC-like DNA-binding protein
MSYNHKLLFAVISKHLHENPASSIRHLSTVLGISYRTIQHIVDGESGKTFSTLRGEILIARVKQLFIAQPWYAIKEVSSALGFSSPRTFGRAVKRACGLSPKEFQCSVGSYLGKEDENVLVRPT